MASKAGWFFEQSEQWPGQAFGLAQRRVLYERKTAFQHVLVFESAAYGNVLVLDGVVQATERDEFAYQEMITHVPMMAHPAPKRVLVVGGGDGGCVREVLKHASVERVDLVEIDGTVIELAQKYLPRMAACLAPGADPRVHVHIMDGFEFLSRSADTYDVIISDTSDPDGPAAQLFSTRYFKLLSENLRDQGIVAMQASENVWLKLDVLKQLQQTCAEVFPVVRYAATCVPTYTSGQLGLLVCAKSASTDVTAPARAWADAAAAGAENRYYNEAIHAASFVLPTFAKRFVSN